MTVIVAAIGEEGEEEVYLGLGLKDVKSKMQTICPPFSSVCYYSLLS